MYVIQNVNMANFLIENGQHLLRIDKDKFDKFRLVFLFADTQDMRNTMSCFPKNGGSNNDSLKNSETKMVKPN